MIPGGQKPTALEIIAMKNVLRTLCATVFGVGLLVFSQAQVNNNNNNDDDIIEPAQPFVVKYIRYDVRPDGTIKILGRRTRYVKANHEWRLEFSGPNSDDSSPKDPKKTHVYASGTEGVVARGAGEESRRSVSPSADQTMLDLFRSHKFLRENQRLVRTEELAGLKVYVMRYEINDPDNTNDWTERSYSPKTGLTPLRTVVHFRDGSEVRIEAVSIEFKEVPENLNDDLKELPLREKGTENKKPSQF